MRAPAIAFLSLFALASTSQIVAAQWSPPSNTFVRGSTNNEVDIAIPVPAAGISAFEGLQIDFSYDGAVFEPFALTRIPTSNDMYFSFAFASLIVSDPIPGSTTVVGTLFLPADPVLSYPDGVDIPGPGTLYHATVRFNVLAAASLGSTTVTAAFDTFKGYSDSVSFDATIVAVPEPETWATMLFGLALVAGVTVRRTGMRLPLA